MWSQTDCDEPRRFKAPSELLPRDVTKWWIAFDELHRHTLPFCLECLGHAGHVWATRCTVHISTGTGVDLVCHCSCKVSRCTLDCLSRARYQHSWNSAAVSTGYLSKQTSDDFDLKTKSLQSPQSAVPTRTSHDVKRHADGIQIILVSLVDLLVDSYIDACLDWFSMDGDVS